MGFIHHQYQIDPSADTTEFRRILKQISSDHHPSIRQFKDDRTTTVSLALIGERRYIVKRYNTKNTLHFIRRFFQQSRARNCWNMSKTFSQAGILTAHRVALIQEQLGPLKLRSWFISEYIEADDLGQHLLSIKDQNHLQFIFSQLKSDIEHLFKSLAKHQLSHGDMKATNILVFNSQIYMIDLDAASQHRNKTRFERAARKDWSRFMKNWKNHAKLNELFSSVGQVIPMSKS